MKFRSNPASITGSIVPLVTPFDRNGDLDGPSLLKLANWAVSEGSHGLSIGGSTGEPGVQTVSERVAAMNLVAEVTGDERPYVVGTGSLRLKEVLELTDAAMRVGADAVLVVTPYYARPSQKGMVAWYSAIASEFPEMPIIIYNVPSRTAVDIAPETVATLRRAHNNIVGIKETTKDFSHYSYVLDLCGRDFLMWSGIELLCLPLLSLGGIGFFSAIANVAPRAIAGLYNAWASGQLEEATRLHYAIHPVVSLLDIETNPVAIKFVLAEMGVLASSAVRLPMTAPNDSEAARIRAILDENRPVLPGLTVPA